MQIETNFLFRNSNFHDFSMIFPRKWNSMIFPYQGDFFSHFPWFPWFLPDGGLPAHICVSELTIIGSDNGLSPGRRQAITWTNVGILLIEPLGTNFSEISIWIQAFSFKKMDVNMSSAKWRPFCLSLNVLSEAWPKWPTTCRHHSLTQFVERKVLYFE